MSTEPFTSEKEIAFLLSKLMIQERERLSEKYFHKLDRKLAHARQGDAAAHLWLGQERWREGIRRTFELSRDPDKAKRHWRIAARLNNTEAMAMLRMHGDYDLGARDIPQTGTRTAWLDGEIAPAHDGLYERALVDEVVYAIWEGGCWSEQRADVGQLLDEHLVGTLSFGPSPAQLPWRGLASDPNPAPVAYWPVRPNLRAGIQIDAIIVHDDSHSSVEAVAHLATRTGAMEGGYAAMCGAESSSGQVRIWNHGPNLKVLYGQPLPICRDCEELACDTTAGGVLYPQPVAVADITLHHGRSNVGLGSDGAAATGVGESSQSASRLKRFGYYGGIRYKDGSSTPVEKFEIADDNNIALEVYSTPDSNTTMQFVLRGTATKVSGGLFETPWIRPMFLNGTPYKNYSAKLKFVVIKQEDKLIEIEGSWIDDKFDYEYSFYAVLIRKPPNRY